MSRLFTWEHVLKAIVVLPPIIHHDSFFGVTFNRALRPIQFIRILVRLTMRGQYDDVYVVIGVVCNGSITIPITALHPQPTQIQFELPTSEPSSIPIPLLQNIHLLSTTLPTRHHMTSTKRRIVPAAAAVSLIRKILRRDVVHHRELR